MITLEGIKALLVIAGISRLKIDFDDKRKLVIADYVYKGESAIKQITYQEIIDSFTIGLTKKQEIKRNCELADELDLEEPLPPEAYIKSSGLPHNAN